MFVAVLLWVLVFTSIDNWYDSWREYAQQTRLTGVCAEDPEADECEEGNFEPWMIAPWGLTVGVIASSIVIVWPMTWRYHTDN